MKNYTHAFYYWIDKGVEERLARAEEMYRFPLIQVSFKTSKS